MQLFSSKLSNLLFGYRISLRELFKKKSNIAKISIFLKFSTICKPTKPSFSGQSRLAPNYYFSSIFEKNIVTYTCTYTYPKVGVQTVGISVNKVDFHFFYLVYDFLAVRFRQCSSNIQY